MMNNIIRDTIPTDQLHCALRSGDLAVVQGLLVLDEDDDTGSIIRLRYLLEILVGSCDTQTPYDYALACWRKQPPRTATALPYHPAQPPPPPTPPPPPPPPSATAKDYRPIVDAILRAYARLLVAQHGPRLAPRALLEAASYIPAVSTGPHCSDTNSSATGSIDKDDDAATAATTHAAEEPKTTVLVALSIGYLTLEHFVAVLEDLLLPSGADGKANSGNSTCDDDDDDDMDVPCWIAYAAEDGAPEAVLYALLRHRPDALCR